MPRYCFHVRYADDMLPDDEGTDLPDLDAARELALESARDLLGDGIKAGKGIVPESIVVADADGQELVSVPFGARAAEPVPRLKQDYIASIKPCASC